MNLALRQLGAYKVTITAMEQKEGGNKNGKTWGPKIAVTFQAEDGRLIDGNFKIPFTEEKNKWDKKQFAELMKVVGATKPSEIKGKTLAIVVSPREWEGKIFWNPSGYFNEKYLLSSEEGLDSALDNLSDDLGF